MTMKVNDSFVINVHDNQPGGFCLLDWYEGKPEAVAFTDSYPRMRHEISEYIKDTDGECDLMVIRVVCKPTWDEGVYKKVLGH